MALATHTPAEWNDILSTTMHNYRKSLTDNVFNSRPLLNFFMSNGRVRTISGGISIVEPLMYSEGEGDSYSEWEQLVVTPQNTATAAQFPWRQLYATIAISGLEEAQNNGKEMMVNLLEAKITQAEETLKTRLNGMLFGTYANDPATDFIGLPTLVDDTAAVGGIDPATEAWWASLTDTATAVDAAGLEAALRKMYNKTSDAGTDRVDAIFTNDYGFGFYESTLTPQVRYTDTSKANLGFQNLMFKDVPMFWDFQCSGGTEGTVADDSASFYLLNSKYVGLAIHTDRNFKQSPFTDNLSGSVASTATAGIGSASANALDARVSFITTYGDSTIRNRRRCGKITSVTSA
jgi:hypothetical protein